MNHKHYHVFLVSKGHDIAKILIMLGFNINQSIKQSINQTIQRSFVRGSTPAMAALHLYSGKLSYIVAFGNQGNMIMFVVHILPPKII
jgi:hypothetical protein